MEKPNSNFNNLIITFSNDFYKFYYALSLASTLKATGKDVSIFISGYACCFIKKNWQDYDKEGINEKLKKKKNGINRRNVCILQRARSRNFLL